MDLEVKMRDENGAEVSRVIKLYEYTPAELAELEAARAEALTWKRRERTAHKFFLASVVLSVAYVAHVWWITR